MNPPTLRQYQRWEQTATRHYTDQRIGADERRGETPTGRPVSWVREHELQPAEIAKRKQRAGQVVRP